MLSKKESLEAAITVYEQKAKGESDTAIMALLGVDAEEYQRLVDLMFATKADEFKRRKPEEIFVSYSIDAERDIRDLSELVNELNEKTQYNAIVGAIRLRREIRDKVIEKGQDLGVISKVTEVKKVLNFNANLDVKEFRTFVAKEVKNVHELMESFGDGNILEAPQLPLYYGDGATLDTTAEEAPEPELKRDPPKPKKKKRPK